MKIKEGFYLSPCGNYKVEVYYFVSGSKKYSSRPILEFCNKRQKSLSLNHAQLVILLSGWERLEE